MIGCREAAGPKCSSSHALVWSCTRLPLRLVQMVSCRPSRSAHLSSRSHAARVAPGSGSRFIVHHEWLPRISCHASSTSAASCKKSQLGCSCVRYGAMSLPTHLSSLVKAWTKSATTPSMSNRIGAGMLPHFLADRLSIQVQEATAPLERVGAVGVAVEPNPIARLLQVVGRAAPQQDADAVEEHFTRERTLWCFAVAAEGREFLGDIVSVE